MLNRFPSSLYDTTAATASFIPAPLRSQTAPANAQSINQRTGRRSLSPSLSPMTMKPIRLYSSCSVLRLQVRASHPHFQKLPSLAAIKSKPQLRNTSTMAATSMQKSNRLRTAFVENKGPSYGIWVLLSLKWPFQPNLFPSTPDSLPMRRCQYRTDKAYSKCSPVPTFLGHLRGRIQTVSHILPRLRFPIRHVLGLFENASLWAP